MRSIRKFLFAAILALATAAATAATAPIPAFTAHYQVLQSGQPIGKATLILARGDNGTWTFTTDSKGTSGLASLLAASTHEVSTFRWVGGLPQGIDYAYEIQTTLKTKRRQVHFDWTTHTVTVEDHGTSRFPTQPGALERHTVPLALAAGLAAGKKSLALPVAVRDRIETQHYAVQGQQTVTVPDGTFSAIRVGRTDGGEALEAWFAPAQLPVPVKINEGGKHDFSLELESWSAQS